MSERRQQRCRGKRSGSSIVRNTRSSWTGWTGFECTAFDSLYTAVQFPPRRSLSPSTPHQLTAPTSLRRQSPWDRRPLTRRGTACGLPLTRASSCTAAARAREGGCPLTRRLSRLDSRRSSTLAPDAFSASSARLFHLKRPKHPEEPASSVAAPSPFLPLLTLRRSPCTSPPNTPSAACARCAT